MIAQSSRIGQRECSRFYSFKGKVDSGDFFIRASQRAKHQQRVFGFRQNNPLTPACFDKRTNSEAQAILPKTLG